MSVANQSRSRHSRANASPIALALLAIVAAVGLAPSPALAQAGDECATALTAVEGLNGPVSTVTMTPSPDTPANETCPFLNWTAATKDVWWVFVPPRAGRLSLDFCNSDFDTSVVVYEGSTCSSFTRVDCDDDGCNATSFQSAIDNLPVRAGIPIRIRVGGYQGASGTVRFKLTLSEHGRATAWGGPALVPTSFIAVQSAEVGSLHVVALNRDGWVTCVGDNFYGQCSPPGGLAPMRDIAAGGQHSAAVNFAGGIACWGRNSSGQCSPPSDLGPVAKVAAGQAHTAVITLTGAVRCFGSNSSGQCTVPPLGAARDIAAGGEHTVAIQRPGLVVCWGGNIFGQSTVPAGLGFTRIKAVAAGGTHTVALTRGGTVLCWGSNTLGQTSVPAGLGAVTGIAAGGNHTVALRPDGTVVCWGSSTAGQLSPPSGVAPFDVVAAGEFTSIGIAFDIDQNGVVDVEEIPNKDCNVNGFHDSWDRLDELIEDCNDNGIGDVCEKSLTVVANSGILTPIGAGHPQSYPVQNVAPALDSPLNPVKLTVEGRGDFGGIMEYLTLRIGKTFAVEAFRATMDCGAGSQTAEFEIEPGDFNALIEPDGSLTIDVEPSIAVDPFLCTPFTFVRLRLEYIGARPADCNANGLLDSCEIAAGLTPDVNTNGVPDDCESPFTSCPTDTDGSGETGASDLAAVLGAWGGSDPIFDFNGDGTVGAADLALLLSFWGPCLPK